MKLFFKAVHVYSYLKSLFKLICGTFNVHLINSKYTIDCDFIKSTLMLLLVVDSWLWSLLTSVVFAGTGQSVGASAHVGVVFAIKGVIMRITRDNTVLRFWGIEKRDIYIYFFFNSSNIYVLKNVLKNVC